MKGEWYNMAKVLEQIIVGVSGTNGIQGSIYSLGIQGAPGTEIIINGKEDSPLILNATGVFNINIEDDMPPIERVAVSQKDLLAPVYIDVVYEEKLTKTEGQDNG